MINAVLNMAPQEISKAWIFLNTLNGEGRTQNEKSKEALGQLHFPRKDTECFCLCSSLLLLTYLRCAHTGLGMGWM